MSMRRMEPKDSKVTEEMKKDALKTARPDIRSQEGVGAARTVQPDLHLPELMIPKWPLDNFSTKPEEARKSMCLKILWIIFSRTIVISNNVAAGKRCSRLPLQHGRFGMVVPGTGFPRLRGARVHFLSGSFPDTQSAVS
ncbi:hypothetical protein EDB19DRAFT_1826719 [Suillus lakei]|nr:hypothetical protein EDB19DRAFT_1826719 [Suillus lakei]